MSNTEKQTVHDWSTGSLEIYEIDAPIEETHEAPTADAEPLPDAE
jgi:hypothetical protein